jgi:hypothetical protein
VSSFIPFFKKKKNDQLFFRYPVDLRFPSATLNANLLQVAYTVVILPIAAARFSDWAGKDVPFDVTIFWSVSLPVNIDLRSSWEGSISDTVFLLSGIVNVTLFTTTRRILPPGSIKLPRFSVEKRAISRPQIITEYDLESGSLSSHQVSGTYALKKYLSIDSTEEGPSGIQTPPASESKEVIPNS